MIAPIFVPTDPAKILQEVLDGFATITGNTPKNGQPEYAICEMIAYEKVLTLNRINETGKSQLIDFAVAPVLDYLAIPYGVERILSQKATTILQFNLVAGHGNVVIPMGTRARNESGVIFETIDDLAISAGINVASIMAECQTSGLKGNDIPIGAIKLLQDPLAYVSSVSNTEITTGGVEEESDENFRIRIKLAPSRFSVAGSKNAYIYWAKTASPLIKDVQVLTYTEDNTIAYGEVDIYALLENGILPSIAINESVESVLNSEDIRPLTDNVQVKMPTIRNYSLTIDVVKSSNANGSEILNKLNTIIAEYGNTQKARLGMDIVCSQIEKLCMIDGVYDISITIVPASGILTGRNLIVPQKEVSVLTGKTITITGANNG